jgi:putative ABC transport system substrate-binding protein
MIRQDSSRTTRRAFMQGGIAAVAFVGLVGCGMVPSGALQPARVPRVGILCASCRADVTSSVLTPDTLNGAFLEGLRELGYVEGLTVGFVLRGGDGRDDQLPRLAAELVDSGVDLIATTGGTQAALAAKRATGSIPIVFLALADPVGNGLVASFAQPDGNLTGTTSLAPQTVGKRLELLKEIVPGARSIDVIGNAGNPAFVPEWRDTQAAAQQLGLTLRLRDARDEPQIRAAFSTTTADRPDALLIVNDTTLVTHSAVVAQLAAANKLPAMYGSRRPMDYGALMCYGADSREQFRSGAYFVDKILKGARPADLPVQQPTRFDFVINLKRATDIGLTIPQSVLLQATEVIQ